MIEGIVLISLGIASLTLLQFRRWAEGRTNVVARLAKKPIVSLPHSRYRMSLSNWLTMHTVFALVVIAGGVAIVLRAR
jgi:hypothetical protein